MEQYPERRFNININQPYHYTENSQKQNNQQNLIPQGAFMQPQHLQPNIPTVQLSPPLSREQILQVFYRSGYPQQSMISKQKLLKLLKERYKKSTNKQIREQLVKQFWQQSEATTKGQISINTISSIIYQAQKILIERIQKLTTQKHGPSLIGVTEKQLKQKKQQLQIYFNCLNDSLRTKMNEITKQLMNKQILLKQYKLDLDVFVDDYESINAMFSEENHYIKSAFPQAYSKVNTQYLNPNTLYRSQLGLPHSYSKIPKPQQHMKKQKSTRLLLLFHLTNILLFLQFLIMSSVRVSMVPLTSYLHFYYIIFYGINSKNAILYLIAHYVFSIIGDITFIVLTLQGKYLLMPFGFDSSFYRLYTIILLIILAFSIIARLITCLFLLSFKNAFQNQTIYYFSLMGYFLPEKSNSFQIVHPQYQTKFIDIQRSRSKIPQENYPSPNLQIPQNTSMNNQNQMMNQRPNIENQVSQVTPYNRNIDKALANFMLSANQSGGNDFVFAPPIDQGNLLHKNQINQNNLYSQQNQNYLRKQFG